LKARRRSLPSLDGRAWRGGGHADEVLKAGKEI